jgi:uncharacterized RDD family membrane protein YckC
MMAKARFRDVKQGRVSKESKKRTKREEILYPTVGERIKAFITDSFMLLMPILYGVIYLVMGSREGFAQNMLLGWVYIVIPLVMVETIFIIKTGQTPGMRAYEMRVVDATTKEIPKSVGLVVVRQVLGVVDFLLFGWLLIFFRKDRRTPHEILTNTMLIKTKNQNG